MLNQPKGSFPECFLTVFSWRLHGSLLALKYCLKERDTVAVSAPIKTVPTAQFFRTRSTTTPVDFLSFFSRFSV